MRQYFGLPLVGPSTRPTVMPDYLYMAKQYLRNESETDGKSLADLKDTYYQMFHATVDEVRIQIPTGHVYGRADPWFRNCMDSGRAHARKLCSVLAHDGGHIIPRPMSEDICDLIEDTVDEGTLALGRAGRSRGVGVVLHVHPH